MITFNTHNHVHHLKSVRAQPVYALITISWSWIATILKQYFLLCLSLPLNHHTWYLSLVLFFVITTAVAEVSNWGRPALPIIWRTSASLYSTNPPVVNIMKSNIFNIDYYELFMKIKLTLEMDHLKRLKNISPHHLSDWTFSMAKKNVLRSAMYSYYNIFKAFSIILE